MFELGVKQQGAGHSRQAIVLLTEAISSHGLATGDMARAVFDRGLAYDSLGNCAAAIADYSEALRLAPSLVAARNNRGNAYRRIGQLENAKRDYLAALSDQGGAHQYPYYGLGLIAGQAGDNDGARSYFQKALAVDSGFAPAKRGMAALNSKLNNKVTQKPAATLGVAALSRSVAEVHLRPAISDANKAAAMVQLGAFRDEETARAGWIKAVAADGALEGMKPVIVVADVPGRGRFWRLRVPLSGQQAARTLCIRLVTKGQACILAPS
ncbi:MAG: tetratricopeptide repeat protein [Rhizomicrobium sp.]|nr:tetratricopeptide repeat protein [Rhizomicrobium sp.]